MTLKELMERQALNTRRHPRDEEHALQCACVRWYRTVHRDMAHSLFAVPNGGRRDKATGARLKEEGVLAGVADLILLQRRGGYGALLIEMKTAGGRQSQSQKEWQAHVEADGYRYVVCRSLDEFMAVVEKYLDNEDRTD